MTQRVHTIQRFVTGPLYVVGFSYDNLFTLSYLINDDGWVAGPVMHFHAPVR